MILLAACLAFAGTHTGPDGVAVTVDAPERVVTLGGSLTSVVFALGLGDAVVGVDASSLHPAEATERPQVGYYRQVGAEGVLALRPDLIIASEDAGPPEALAQLRAAGVPVAIFDSAHGHDAAMTRVMNLATLLDREAVGKELVVASATALGKRCQPEEPPSVAFLFGRGSGNLVVAGSETAAEAIIELAGGTNAIDGYEGYQPLATESLLVASPDVLLTTTRVAQGLGGVEGLGARPEIAATPAGKAGRIVVMDDLLLLGFDERTGEAARQLSQELCK